MIENPAFSHTFPSHHPTYRFDNVFVPEKNRIGGKDLAWTTAAAGLGTKG